jgi:hypothetical protein
MQATVKWQGLDKLQAGMKSKGTKSKRYIREWNELAGDLVEMRYIDNLSGSRPSTAASPLPVGVRSGTLKAGVHKEKKGGGRNVSVEITNRAGHAGWIEDGTYKMAPRKPLKDAVDKTEKEVPGQLGDVMVKIVAD